MNNVIIETFNDNIAYIQEYHPSLFSKLAAFDSAIENGHYNEKYKLVYENDNFDVLEISTQKYLYDKNSSYFVDLSAKSIDYDINDNTFECFYKHTILDEDLIKYEQKALFEDHMSGHAPIISYIQRNSKKEITLKKVEKFIFFGVGLGLHINSIDKKIKSKVYFIIEDDLELFRLSLFTTNYKKLSINSKIVFSIFEDNDEFSASSEFFLNTMPYSNHYIKYFNMLNFDDNKRNLFHITVTNQPHLLFFYNALLTQYIKPLDYIFNDYKFINKTINLSKSKIAHKPFLLLAAGPSLQKNIVWLKKNHKKFITVAITSILPYLEEKNIVPDIITHLDAFDEANRHFEAIKSLNFIKDSICIFSARLPLTIINKVNKNHLFLFENGTQYLRNSLKPSSPCVGSITYQILLFLRAKNIYLLGLDQTIDNITGKTHSDSQEYLTVLNTDIASSNEETMKFKESLFYVEGNHEEKLLTTPHFKAAIDAINYSTNMIKQKEQNIYNISNGAKFKDTHAKKCSEINIPNIELDDSLLNVFNENSFYPLDENVLESLKNKSEHAKELKKHVMIQLNNHFTDDSSFIKSLELLAVKLTNKSDLNNYELTRVIDTYLKYILGYIFNFLNTQRSNSEDYNTINKQLTNHLLIIINYYYDKINDNI